MKNNFSVSIDYRLGHTLVAVILVSIVLSPTLVVFATSDEANSDNVGSNNDDWNESCRDTGYDHGRDSSFSQDTYDHCGDETRGDDAYFDGFINGCMSLEGNTRDVCESATDR